MLLVSGDTYNLSQMCDVTIKLLGLKLCRSVYVSREFLYDLFLGADSLKLTSLWLRFKSLKLFISEQPSSTPVPLYIHPTLNDIFAVRSS